MGGASCWAEPAAGRGERGLLLRPPNRWSEASGRGGASEGRATGPMDVDETSRGRGLRVGGAIRKGLGPGSSCGHPTDVHKAWKGRGLSGAELMRGRAERLHHRPTN